MRDLNATDISKKLDVPISIFILQCLFSQGINTGASENLAAAVEDISISSCPYRKPKWQNETVL